MISSYIYRNHTHSILRTIIIGVFGCLLLFNNSCSPVGMSGYSFVNQDVEQLNLPKVFNQDTISYLYKADIQVFKKQYGGLLVINPYSEDSARIVFMTEIGIKIFDFGFYQSQDGEEDFKIHYILEVLNKKALIKTLANDFGLLLMRRNYKNLREYKLIENSYKNYAVKHKYKGGNTIFYIDKEIKHIYEIIQSSSVRKKVKILLDRENKTIPSQINISHYRMKLNINLRLLEQY